LIIEDIGRFLLVMLVLGLIGSAMGV